MIRSVAACCCLLLFSPLSAFGASLTSDIAAYLTASDSKQRYIACLVLAEVPLDKETENRIRRQHKTKNDEQDQLCFAYVLAKRTQERVYQSEFVRLYPSGKQQTFLWKRHTEAGYPFSVLSPFIAQLADLARTDDAALVKLASGLPFADGAHAESLIDELAELYRANPSRVKKALRSASAETHAELIRKTATQKEKHRE